LDDQRRQLSAARGRAAGRAALAVLLFAVMVGCGVGVPRFRNTFDSPESLAVEVLRALKERDRDRLTSLPLTEDEFRGDVFREMPAFGRVPSDYVWRDLQQKSGYSLAHVLETYGGRGYELERVLLGQTSSYRSFVVFRKPRLVLRDPATGGEVTVQLFGSILRHSGQFKLFSFVVNS
jgi:hypothetical protein